MSGQEEARLELKMETRKKVHAKRLQK